MGIKESRSLKDISFVVGALSIVFPCFLAFFGLRWLSVTQLILCGTFGIGLQALSRMWFSPELEIKASGDSEVLNKKFENRQIEELSEKELQEANDASRARSKDRRLKMQMDAKAKTRRYDMRS